MKRIVLATVLGLVISCGGVGRVPVNPKPCTIPAWPADPELTTITTDCPPSSVCLAIKSAVALGLWVRDALRVREALTTCPFVISPAVADPKKVGVSWRYD